MDDTRGPRRLAGRLASRLRRGSERPDERERTLPEPTVPTDPVGEPLVSVVVPVYAVEQYVDECLTSILAQTYRRLEVVVVDDGSPDGSMDIVGRHAASDDRVRIVTQANAGLGAARNRGIAEARGDLITFVDSDDTIPAGAIAAHVRSLVRSGSDFSVGALERQQSETSYVQRPWSRRLHEVHRRGVTVEEAPDAMANVFACTKVFRRSFVDAIGLRFPVGVRYEDQVPVAGAYLRARAFDILPDVVYRWRSRRDGSSITQQKARTDDLHDRLAAVGEVARMVRETGSSRILQAWYGKVFEFDLMAYIRASLDTDDDYRDTLASTVRDIVDGAPPEAWTFVELRHRLAAWTLVHEDRATLTRLLESPLLTGNIPVRDVGDALVADTDALGLHAGVPAELLAVTEKDLLVEARLDGLAWDGDDLVVRGVGFTRYVDAGRPHEVSLLAQRPRVDEQISVQCRTTRVADANVFADRHFEDHRDDGFEARLPATELVQRSGDGVKSVWHTRVACSSVGGTRAAVMRDRLEHGDAVAATRRRVGDALVEATWSDRLGLVLHVRRDWVRVTAQAVTEGEVVWELEAAPGVVPEVVLSRKQRLADVVKVDASAGHWRARIATGELARAEPDRRIVVRTADGEVQPVLTEPSSDPVSVTGTLTVLCTGDGFVRPATADGVLVVEEVQLGEGVARLGGRVRGSRPASLRLVGPRGSTRAAPVRGADDRWSALLPLVAGSSVGPEELPVPRDTYDLVTDGEHLVVAGVAPDAEPDPGRPWQVRIAEGRRLRLERGRGADVDDYTRHGQRRLQTGAYQDARAAERRPWVLLDSFVGRGGWHACAAVARALSQARPDLELVWSTRDESLPVPPGVTPSLRLSEDWYRRLGGAAHVVANGTLPRWFDKAAGQRVVQLWTGTPVLRFGHALLEADGSEADLRVLDADVAQWDVLCTGGPEATAWLREATGWRGPVHEVGHPALDTWAGDDYAQRRADARRRLGLDDDPVLLYAPTTRRAVRAHTRREKIALLDPQALVSAVPGLTVLMRGHPNTANQQVLDAGPGVVDVTHHPELADLLVAADAVVTDYSTLLVDVLASPTPLALLVPDREDFEELGFFPDLFSEPPGPVVSSTEELVPWLTGGLASPYPGRDKLRERLLPLDDGHAARRVVEAAFGDR